VIALAPRVDAASADRHFQRATRWLRWRRQIMRHPFAFRSELVGLPAYRSIWRHAGNAHQVDLLIGGLDGTVRRLDGRTPFASDLAFHLLIDPIIPPEDALHGAQRALQQLRLSARKSAGATLQADPPTPLVHPFWAYYFPRRGDILDVSLLDAVEGRWAGPRIRLAYIDALIRRQQPGAAPELALSAS
jgi:hypothetical protein